MSSTLSLSPIELFFNNKTLREVIHEGVKYYPIMDVIVGATGSRRPDVYWYAFKNRKKLSGEIQYLTKCSVLKLKASDGKSYEYECYTRQQVIQILQSIPSKKAERFRQWFSQIIEERFQEEENAELAYKRGYERAHRRIHSMIDDPERAKERMEGLTCRVRNSHHYTSIGLTGEHIARITDKSYRVGFGLSTRSYYSFKGLKQKNHNLRDHMTLNELTFISLYERTLESMIKKNNPSSFEEIKEQSDKASLAIRKAREAFESVMGEPVVSSENFLNTNKKIKGE